MENDRLEGRVDGKIWLAHEWRTPKEAENFMKCAAKEVSRVYSDFARRAAYHSGVSKVKPC